MANDRTNVRLVKADAVIDITALILDRGLTFDQAAELAGTDVKTLRGIVHEFRVDGISLGRLDKIVEALEAVPGNRRKM